MNLTKDPAVSGLVMAGDAMLVVVVLVVVLGFPEVGGGDDLGDNRTAETI